MKSDFPGAFLRNAATALRAFLPLRFDVTQLAVTGGQVVLAALLYVAALVLSDLAQNWPVSRFEPWGLTSTFASLSVWALSAAVALGVVRRPDRVMPALFATFIGSILWVGCTTLVVRVSGADPWNTTTIVILWIAYLIIPVGILRFARGQRLIGFGRGLVAAVIFSAGILAFSLFVPRSPIFYPGGGEEVSEAVDYKPIDTEAIYYAQPGLMRDATDRLRPGTPGQPDLFAVLGAGTAYQGVFLREVTQVDEILKPLQRHQEGRNIILANSSDDPFARPLLGRANLKAALAAIAEKADPDEDATLIYLTSHGSKDSFSLGFWQIGLEELTAPDFAEMLQESGLRNVIVVIAACYSGSFIDDLSAPDRLIITAAAADRLSFGCAAENEWTDFGRAYFDEAFRETGDFRLAFERAAETVAKREAERGDTPSQPQIFVGDEMAAFLDRFGGPAAPAGG